MGATPDRDTHSGVCRNRHAVLGVRLMAWRIPKRFGLKQPGFVIGLDMFQHDIPVFFNFDDAEKYLKKYVDATLCGDKDRGTALAHTGAAEDEQGIKYWFMVFHSTPPLVGVLAHECVHVAIRVCEERGVPIEEDCDETFAYMVGYLVQQTMDEMVQLAKEGAFEDGTYNDPTT